MTQGTPPKGGRVGLRFNALHVNILFLSPPPTLHTSTNSPEKRVGAVAEKRAA